MWLLYLITLPIGIGVAFYFKAFLKKSLSSFGVDCSQRKTKLILWSVSLCLGALCLNILRFGSILVLHLFVLTAAVQFVNFLVKICFKKRFENGFRLWKRIYALGIIPLLVTALLMSYGYVNMHRVVRTDFEVFTKKDVGDGYRVVLIADVHYGVSIGDKELTEKRNEINALNADVVVLCGDIVDSATSKTEMETVFKVLGETKTKYGVFYVYGNHDRSHSYGGSFTDKELETAIKESGIRILEDEAVSIDESLYLIGREDKGYNIGKQRRKSIGELTEGLDEKKFILTLDHQPTEYTAVGESPTDLLLSGHTHAGQLWPMKHIFQLFGINDGVYGKIAIDNDTTAIVTSGFAGWSYPVKTAAPAEYAIIDIKKKL